MNKKNLFTVLVISVILAFFVYLKLKPAGEEVYSLSGFTMGTTYHIKVISESVSDKRLKLLKEKIDKTLLTVNKQMSTFDEESEISMLNRAEAGEKVLISQDFYNVLLLSKKIHSETGGKFDPTLAPLIDLWGFGPGHKKKHTPPESSIRKALKDTGFSKLVFHKGFRVSKTTDNLSLNLSAIAKGFGVDKVAQLLAAEGYKNYMVEVGGEIYVAGRSLFGRPWHLAVQNPSYDSAVGEDNIMIINLSDMAVATSGDYRNYFSENGKHYNHVIDPRTGYPEETDIASSTVIAGRCAEADGLATSLMLLGKDKGLKLINSLPGIEAMVIIRKHDGSFSPFYSEHFRDFVNKDMK